MVFKIEGEVFSGMGEGADYLSKEPYQDKIKDLIGFKPFPGTLNLRVDEEKVEELREEFEPVRLESFEHEDQEYSGMDIYLVEIAGIEAAYLDLDLTDYDDDVMEIIAPVNLRDLLGLEDEDKVEAEVAPSET